MEPHWIYCIGLTYLVCLTGFFLLTRKSSWAFPLLMAGSIMTFMMEILTILLMTFSLVLLILFVYLTVSTTLLAMDGIHKRILKQRKQNQKEAQEWGNRQWAEGNNDLHFCNARIRNSHLHPFFLQDTDDLKIHSFPYLIEFIQRYRIGQKFDRQLITGITHVR